MISTIIPRAGLNRFNKISFLFQASATKTGKCVQQTTVRLKESAGTFDSEGCPPKADHLNPKHDQDARPPSVTIIRKLISPNGNDCKACHVLFVVPSLACGDNGMQLSSHMFVRLYVGYDVRASVNISPSSQVHYSQTVYIDTQILQSIRNAYNINICTSRCATALLDAFSFFKFI